MLRELLKQKAEAEARIAVIQEELAAINIDIEHAISQKILDLRSLQNKPFGAVNLSVDGYKITETIPKKVEWDQEKLKALSVRIAASGDTPENYMKIKYEVGEKQYDAFPEGVKEFFAEARTVKPGKAQLKFEEEKC